MDVDKSTFIYSTFSTFYVVSCCSYMVARAVHSDPTISINAYWLETAQNNSFLALKEMRKVSSQQAASTDRLSHLNDQ